MQGGAESPPGTVLFLDESKFGLSEHQCMENTCWSLDTVQVVDPCELVPGYLTKADSGLLVTSQHAEKMNDLITWDAGVDSGGQCEEQKQRLIQNCPPEDPIEDRAGTDLNAGGLTPVNSQ